MRKTKLKKATVLFVVVLLSAAVLLGVLRARFSAANKMPGGKGATLFAEKGCSRCHFTDSRETKIGPGLKGILNRKELPVSKREATPGNVRRQLRDPYRNMPSFAGRLSGDQADALIEYLKRL